MPPCKSNRGHPPITPTQPPPPPQFNTVIFQDVVIAAVTAPLTHINASGTSGGGTSVNLTQGDSHGNLRECS